ncbi:MAG: diacylglycerol kinase family protein [Thermoguttaceae bacterium]
MNQEQEENESPESDDSGNFIHSHRTWRRKFRDAFVGLRQSVHQQSSYKAHFFFAFLVVFAGFFLRLDIIRWSIIVLCIATVLAAEMLNTSIETLAKAVTSKYDENVARSLNIASGAILVLSFGAAIVGFLILGEAVYLRFGK